MQVFRAAGAMRSTALWAFLAALPQLLSCTAYAADAAGSGKSSNLSVIYGALLALSFLLFVGYCFLVKKKTVWFLLLYISVFVVNGGYLALSLAKNLDSALLANQFSYFGAAMLPLAMLMIIVETCRIPHPGWLPVIFALISLGAFLLAASGGYSTLYYKEVSIVVVDGVCHLNKVYGPLHFLYAVYLFSYFGMMIAAIVYAAVRKMVVSCKYVVFLASAVFGNLAVWFVEQLVYVNFEFLSVSYIASELILLSVHSMLQDYGILTAAAAQAASCEEGEEGAGHALPPDVEELFSVFSHKASALTAAERSILQYYAEGYEIGQVAEAAFISIHTVRKHNANMYQKLGVGSRDELMLYLDLFRRCGRLHEILQPPREECEAGQQ